jgi:hypothetical protein
MRRGSGANLLFGVPSKGQNRGIVVENVHFISLNTVVFKRFDQREKTRSHTVHC